MLNKKNLIWIDLEMTGLNPKIDRILEIATIITDSNLKILAEGPNIIIKQKKKIIDSMNNWNKKTHKKNQLIKMVQNSNYNEKYAEKKTIKFLSKWIQKNISPICGNSIGNDRRFLYKYMPKLESYFHYRYLDVSSIRELAKRWKPEITKYIKYKNKHRAKKDLKNSIKELKFYKNTFFTL
ncbi:oligoribonuclease [Candidatus Purcelliella pentastirinorum]|uniref:Oligoribonuclease n=1 Tax=Candidatus Purcelliella pentastirinorum TaxID=472834 RepID=A0AAX3N7V5_9ENTR|nr:oligoribonuclease [Candidatus Purcelliella pentastirinorum]WDI78514.1 oligoribonuclease [Candidatus Purcelliella pentastirinorum]WDR80457.1 oligoribonuclease [Candidatus Purcelliella pentastirinorum]